MSSTPVEVTSSSLEAGMSNGGSGLDMDCGTRVGYDCQLYIQDYLETYINVNKSYNKLVRPVLREEDVLQVDISVTFVELLDIDTKTGTMTTYVFVDYFWNDAFLHWNSSLTDNDDFYAIPNDLVYTPDIIAYNTMRGFASGLDAVVVLLSSDGSVWWSARGILTTSCYFDVQDFPFDSQQCNMDFSSWTYSILRINISNVYIDVFPSFDNLAWNVSK